MGSLVRFGVIGQETAQENLFSDYQGLDLNDVLKGAASLSSVRFEQAGKLLGVSSEELMDRGWAAIQRETDDPRVLNRWLRVMRLTLAMIEGDVEWFAETYRTIDEPILQLRAFVDNLVILQREVAKANGVDVFSAELLLSPDEAFAAE